jgi:hypothetical protein
MEVWREEAQAVAFRNLAQMQELFRVVGELEAHDIPVISFKGPLLAQVAYGDVTYRRFVDLDILVRRDDISRAKECLKQAGYSPYRQLDAQQESKHIATQRGYEFVHDERRSLVELHWSFFFEIYDFDLDPDAVWDRHHSVRVGGMCVRTMSPEDLLIYLCAHGTKHRWTQMKWVTDVAELVRSHPDLDWATVEDRARSIGYWRVVRLGIYLTVGLLELSVPPYIERAARTDRRVPNMARQVVDEWLFRSPKAEPATVWSTFWFHVKEADHLRDRWPYIKHHLDLWLGPTVEDRNAIRLPQFLFPFYYIIGLWRRLVNEKPTATDQQDPRSP